MTHDDKNKKQTITQRRKSLRPCSGSVCVARTQSGGKEKMKTTWKELITDAMENSKESWDDVVSCTLTENELEKKFDGGYGGSEGKPFTLWTKKRVYFPVVYDGSEWVESVSRRPDKKPSGHFGGE
jgi:hypothetical protein